jgi:putative ABC transport system permease protein
MVALTLAQMRRSIGRLAAGGLAIAIGTAFVAATLLASGVITSTALDAMTAAYADTDLVVTGEGIDDDAVATVADVPGVEVADGPLDGGVQLRSGGRIAYLATAPVPADQRLFAQELVAGELPGDGEVAVPVDTAARLGVEVGDRVEAVLAVWEPAAGDAATGDAETGEPAGELDGAWDGDWVERTEDLRVAGLVEDPMGAFAVTGGAAVVSPTDARRWHDLQDPEGAGPSIASIRVLVDPDRAIADVQRAVTEAVADRDLSVLTREQQAVARAEELSGETNLITALVLGFAAIALVVASLVIANTFAVLVAQRTRQLALLRCVGASRRQLRRSVTLEATLLGVGSSVIGIVGGIGLAQLALTVLRRTAPTVPLPGTVSVTVAVLVVPLVAGTVVTVLAASAPARAAGRVAPLAALRPAGPPSVAAVTSRGRVALTGLATVGGLVLLGAGMVVSARVDVLLGLAVGILGGVLSITGVLVGSVFFVPRLVGWAGGLLGRGGGPAVALATANSVRNPRRTAATSSALLIGVTLVAMMSSGAATARASFDAELDRSFPVDVSVETLQGPSDDAAGIDAALAAEVEGLVGVEEVVPLTGGEVVLSGGTEDLSLGALVVDPAAASASVRSQALLDGFGPDTAIVPWRLAETAGIVDGARVTLTPVDADGSPLDAAARELTARVTDLDGGSMLVAQDVGRALLPEAPVTSLWLRIADDHEAVAVVADVQEVLGEHPVAVTGSAVERAAFDRIITSLLAVVVGLLGVAVVISVVGVANTLSLSVLERRRETATLRAIGLSRRQLRQTLAVEGMLIAGSGALLGTVLGTSYGWIGARTVLGSVADGVTLAVPWRDLALVLVVALLAGLAASVLPGRRAARTSPVAALAAE